MFNWNHSLIPFVSNILGSQTLNFVISVWYNLNIHAINFRRWQVIVLLVLRVISSNISYEINVELR